MNLPITYADADSVDISFDDAADGPPTPNDLECAATFELVQELIVRFNETNGADFVCTEELKALGRAIQAELRLRNSL